MVINIDKTRSRKSSVKPSRNAVLTSEFPFAIKKVLINNRRYLGNKYKLLGFIRKVVDTECQGIKVFADLFAGTGSVSSAFTDKTLIVNDLLYSNHLCHIAWFGAEKYRPEKIKGIISSYNASSHSRDNYVSRNFGGKFFSVEDSRKIGFVREDVERRFKKGEINSRERAILITSLLYAMDKSANTCGHYDAYLRGAKADFGRRLELRMPVARNDNSPGNVCLSGDANALASGIKADLVYIDPPYNSRQYCDAYHLLENVARWRKPKLFGVARKMDRTGLKSDYCTASAAPAFADLISKIKARYILVSYNNMGEKGNGRSNAKMSDEEILGILEARGRVKVFAAEHKAFSAGKSTISDNRERLFLCDTQCAPRTVI